MNLRFKNGCKKSERRFNCSKPEKIKDFRKTEFLEIIPLIDWYTDSSDLVTEAGVSYLIKTDSVNILFDTGYNPDSITPSPLIQNMSRLGLYMDDIDTIVISHNHPDHVGGMKWKMKKSFSLDTKQIPLTGKSVYSPVPMTYPGINPVYTEEPVIIGDGVATTGTICSQLYFLGWTEEQALAVNVEGKGIVLIVGCGHQKMDRLLERFDALFDEPLYGIIGGLHCPLDTGRTKVAGIYLEKYVGTGKVPWKPVTEMDVSKTISLLKKYNPEVVALSPHDSSDRAIDMFRRAFSESYTDIIVGKVISFS